MRKCAVLTFALLVVVLSASPAWAHEEIKPKSFSAGQPTFFLLSVANDQQVDLTKVTVTAPNGVAIGATTKEPAGWTVTKTSTAITWTSGGGAGIKPDHFEQWGFETDGADQPGTYTFKATLGFAGGKTADVQIPVTVVAGGQPAAGTAAQPARPDQAESRANAALVVGGIAVVLALAAMAAALGRGRRQPVTPGEAKARPGGQDW